MTTEKHPTEMTLVEVISGEDRDAIDLYYGYQGSGWDGPTLGAFGFGPKSDEDRMQWMDYKDRMKEKGKDEFFPMQTAMIGFGASSACSIRHGRKSIGADANSRAIDEAASPPV